MKIHAKLLAAGAALALNLAATAMVSVLTISSANAIVVGGGITSTNANGVFQILNPNTQFIVGNDNFQSPNLFAFDENQNINVGPAGLTLDIGSNLGPNQLVASHYVFFDPISVNPLQFVGGFVDFDANIIGIATSTGTLLASDGFQNNLVTYLNPGLRGLENSNGDFAVIDGSDSKRLRLFFRAGTPGDYVRVFTEFSPLAINPVPVPAALPLFGTGLAVMGFIGWRRKRKASA